MPYIEEIDRERMLGHLAIPAKPGDLAYEIALAIDKYYLFHGMSYTIHTHVLGALEGVKFEVQRRIIAPYEDQKRHDNGEVFLSLKEDEDD